MTELTTACECGEDIWCSVCVACEGHCWGTRGDDACQEIRRLQAIPHIRSCMCAKYAEIIKGHEATMREARRAIRNLMGQACHDCTGGPCQECDALARLENS